MFICLVVAATVAQPPKLLGSPIWHPSNRSAEFVFFKKSFSVPSTKGRVIQAQLQVTAEASPAWDSLDAGNMPKLLGAYKLAIDGQVVAMGPGRSRDGKY